MRTSFAEKLSRIVDEARSDAPRAVYIALYMVNACYVHGKHRSLARHICKFSGLHLGDSKMVETVEPTPPTLQ